MPLSENAQLASPTPVWGEEQDATALAEAPRAVFCDQLIAAERVSAHYMTRRAHKLATPAVRAGAEGVKL
jgi:hypothetical protein